MSSSGSSYFYHFDGLGSVTALTDVNGTFVEYYEYNIFGEPNTIGSIGGNPTPAAPASTNLLYAGEQFDTHLGWYYNRARYYDPAIGRFNRLDPFAGRFKETLTFYEYLDCINGTRKMC